MELEAIPLIFLDFSSPCSCRRQQAIGCATIIVERVLSSRVHLYQHTEQKYLDRLLARTYNNVHLAPN